MVPAIPENKKKGNVLQEILYEHQCYWLSRV